MEEKYYNSNLQFLDEDFEFLLAANKHYSAAIIGWKAILQKIFAYNQSNEINYESTESALLLFFQTIEDKELCENIHLIYIMTTQLEYSGGGNFSEYCITKLNLKIKSTNKKLKRI